MVSYKYHSDVFHDYIHSYVFGPVDLSVGFYVKGLKCTKIKLVMSATAAVMVRPKQ